MWNLKWLVVIAPTAFGLAQAVMPASAQVLPDDFVFLHDIAPTIQQDIRYAGANNFVGRPLDGYDGADADCTANEALRAPEASVDMGTGYDCSDFKAHTAAASITPAQRKWRNTLLSVMARQGFVNYAKEWWHFSLPGVAGLAYDFPILRREK